MGTPGVVVGIDLGTTNSCMAVVRRANGEPEIIYSAVGKNTTPSFVSYDDEGNAIVGDAAVSQAVEFPQTTFFDIKRLIGRSYYDHPIQKYMKLLPYELVDIEGHVGVQVWDKILTPQAIVTHLIAHLRTTAQAYLGESVSSAVVTLPAYFNDLQEGLTRVACVKAGLTDVHFISEPIAAAYAYGLHSNLKDGETRTCLIFDLGGGTFDLTVFTINSERKIRIKGIGGDARLGGEDFTDSLFKYCLKKFEEKHGIDIEAEKLSKDVNLQTKTAKILNRLRQECEKQKCHLSSAKAVVVSLWAMHGDKDLNVRVERQVFEDLIKGHLERSIKIVGNILNKTGIRKEAVDDVILIGGSCRIPKVREVVSVYFGGVVVRSSVDGDAAVAAGAAVHAFNRFKGGSTVLVVQENDVLDQYGSVGTPISTTSASKAGGSTTSPKTVALSGREIIRSQLRNLYLIRDLLMEHESRFSEKRDEIGNWLQSLKTIREDFLNNSIQSGKEIEPLLDTPMLSDLAKRFFDHEMFQQALDLNRKICDRRENVLGGDHLETLMAYFHVADSLDNANSQNEQLEKSDALEIHILLNEKCLNIFGASHRLTLKTAYEIAWMYENHKDYPKAFNMFEGILEKQIKAFGPSDEDTIKSERSLGHMFFRMGDVDKALEQYTMVNEKCENIFGPSHRLTLRFRYETAWIYENEKDFFKAFEIMHDTFKKGTKAFGPDDKATLQSEFCISYLFVTMNDIGKALNSFKTVLEKQKKVLGEDHINTLRTEMWIAVCVCRKGKQESALKILQDVSEKCVRRLGPNHALTLEVEGCIKQLQQTENKSGPTNLEIEEWLQEWNQNKKNQKNYNCSIA